MSLFAGGVDLGRHDGGRIATKDEVRRLLGLDSPHQRLWTLLVGLWLRRSEALGLRWKDVNRTDFDGGDDLVVAAMVNR